MKREWVMECFFFNDTATTEIYTLSLHDALPISVRGQQARRGCGPLQRGTPQHVGRPELGQRQRARLAPRLAEARRPDPQDRKSTRLNSSHANISYAVFCLKKKKSTPLLLQQENS